MGYERDGDRVDLYVFSAALSGYPEGVQLATPFTPEAPLMGGNGPWTVTVPLDTSLLQTYPPVRCMVAAQPTEDFQGAPSAY